MTKSFSTEVSSPPWEVAAGGEKSLLNEDVSDKLSPHLHFLSHSTPGMDFKR